MQICFDIKLDKKLIKEVLFNFRGDELKFMTYPDVFAYEKIDEGSALLISRLDIKENKTVADLGCGTGVLGVCASLLTKKQVTLLDIDPKAVALASENAKELAGDNIRVLGSDLFGVCENEKFDVVLCNIPSHLTKEGEARLVNSLRAHLAENGILWIVFQRRIKELIKRQVKKLFKNFKVVVMNKKYMVMRVT